MADSFQGMADISLQPASNAVKYKFTFALTSSATANDGAIPYGFTIGTPLIPRPIVKAFDEGGTDRSAEIVGAISNTTTVVSVDLNYPTVTGVGRYSLEFTLTIIKFPGIRKSMEFDFTRVYAEDIAA